MSQEQIELAKLVLAAAACVVSLGSFAYTVYNNVRIERREKAVEEEVERNRLALEEQGRAFTLIKEEREEEKLLWERKEATRESREARAQALEPKFRSLLIGLDKVRDFLSTGPETSTETVNTYISEIFDVIGDMPGPYDLSMLKYLKSERHAEEMSLFKKLLRLVTVDFSRASERREAKDYLAKMELNKAVLKLTRERLEFLCFRYGVGRRVKCRGPVKAAELVVAGASVEQIQKAVSRPDDRASLRGRNVLRDES
jgi:hypothetical protein